METHHYVFIVILLTVLVAACLLTIVLLLKRLRSAVTEGELAQTDLSAVRTRCEQISSELVSARRKAGESDSELGRRLKEIGFLKEQLAHSVQRIENLESAPDASEQLRSDLVACQQKLADTEREAGKLRTDAKLLQQKLLNAEAQAEDAVARLQRLEVERDQKTEELSGQKVRTQDLEIQLRDTVAENIETKARVAKFEALEARLRSSIEDADKIRMDLERNYHELHVAHQDLAIRSEQLQLDLDKARTELELYKQQSGNDNEAMATLISETAELKSALQRKESALKDLEAAYKSASAETSYEAHRHMQWTLNHFDPDAITLKFQNEGAAVYLVGVETNEPALTYNLETGHSLPRDFEARVRLKFRKGTPANQAKFPESFDLTVLYALHVFPIKFRIHPQAGQKIERIH